MTITNLWGTCKNDIKSLALVSKEFVFVQGESEKNDSLISHPRYEQVTQS